MKQIKSKVFVIIAIILFFTANSNSISALTIKNEKFFGIKKYILLEYKIINTELVDVNKDKTVNVFDSIRLKQDILKEAQTSETTAQVTTTVVTTTTPQDTTTEVTTTPLQETTAAVTTTPQETTAAVTTTTPQETTTAVTTTTPQATTTAVTTTTAQVITTAATTTPQETTTTMATTIVTQPPQINIPNVAFIPNVKPLLQSPELPSGCEATGLTVALNFYGFNVSKVDIAMKYMPRMGFYYLNSRYTGADFIHVFAGDPSTSNAYGCYIPCLISTANNYFSASGINASCVNLTGANLEDLFPYVASGTPVVLISSPDLKIPVQGDSWYTEDGRYVTWQRNHHCMVLIGYNKNDNTVTVADSMRNKGIVSYNMDQFRNIYNLKGKNAMIIKAGVQPNINPNPTTSIVNGGVYCIKNVYSGKYINVDMGYDMNSTNVYQWTKDGSTEQTFKLEYVSATNSYKIRAMCSSFGANRVLDIVKQNGLVANGSNVEIYSPVDPIAQEWNIVDLGGGKFKIEPRSNTSLSLSVSDGSNGTANGIMPNSAGNIFIESYTGNTRQQWIFEKQ